MTDDEIAKLCREWPNNATQAARAIIAAHTAKLLAGVEIPEPEQVGIKEVDWNDFEPSYAYTADQLQQYAAAAAAQAREKALEDAKGVCLNWSERHAIHDGCTYEDCDFVAAATDCAAAIEKLKGKQAC